jgi:hypothetical protein
MMVARLWRAESCRRWRTTAATRGVILAPMAKRLEAFDTWRSALARAISSCVAGGDRGRFGLLVGAGFAPWVCG